VSDEHIGEFPVANYFAYDEQYVMDFGYLSGVWYFVRL